jgi:hypothetical protein
MGIDPMNNISNNNKNTLCSYIISTILEVDIGSDSHRNEDGGIVDWPRGLPKVISMAQQ